MRVYVTGATGFVGLNLVDYFRTRGNVVASHVRSADITAQLQSFQPDVIINCAAEIYDADKMFEPNILLTYKILEYVKESKCRMVQIGSSRIPHSRRHTAEASGLLPRHQSGSYAHVSGLGKGAQFKDLHSKAV